VFFAAIVVLAGCDSHRQTPTRICPGKASVAEALSVLGSRSQDLVPLKASGQCVLEYHEGKKKHKENVAIKLWMSPPFEIYLQGDVAFNPRGLVLGSNEREFWLALKPKEIGNSFYWGKWADGSNLGDLRISPKVLLEALGIVEAEDSENWSLSNEGAFDVLTKRDGRGEPIKRVHVYCCDYRVRKIEYFDDDGRAVVAVELDEYREAQKGVLIPRTVKIISLNRDGAEDSFGLDLKSVKPADLSQKQREFLFDRPEPRGFEHIYQIVGGRVVPEE